MADPLVIAGACGYGVWPENSIEGARACLQTPVDGIEIDVHLTGDGHVVAHHDYRLHADGSRLDGAWLEAPGLLLRDAPLAELRRYDLGRARPGSRRARAARGERDDVVMPTLPALLSVLAQAPGSRRRLFVEIKTDPPDYRQSADPEKLLDAVLADLNAAGWTNHAKIIAFDWALLRRLAEIAPDVATAHLTVPAAMHGDIRRLPNGDSPWADGFDPRRFGGSEAKAIAAHGGQEWSPHVSDVTPERVAEAKAEGLRVGVWGLSKAKDIDHMAVLGADALTVAGPIWAVTPGAG
jgi:glycerophosphoryl diester phosphodiesterase